MARKRSFDYFDSMYQLSITTKNAALALDDIVNNYSRSYLKENAEKVHDLEKAGDTIVASIMDDLRHSFITPIDREDIISITEAIDDVLDCINTMPYLFDNLVINSLNEQTVKMSSLIIEIVEELTIVTKEFSKFKSTKKIGGMVKKVRELEDKADMIHSFKIKLLFSTEENVLEVIRWKEVFDRLEQIVNLSEKAVLIMEIMMIKNT